LKAEVFFLFDPDLGINGEAGAELVVRVFAGKVGEVDANRDALDDLDVVASGVFRREEREDRACCAADLGELAVVGFAG